MIPRLSERSERTDGRGRSFRDLSAYLFNGELDKPDPARAQWAETINCHCSDPSQAWAEMAWTWQHAGELKTAAGVRRGGQKNEFPVWHVSLNWRDDQAPDRTAMMHAARGVLRKFGLEDHQALIVAHNDTGHAHVHLMVNTVNPHNGKTVDVSRSTMYRLSAWALEYEREHGAILCQQRADNWQARTDNKAIYQLAAAQAAFHGQEAPRLQKTYGKSDSRPLWQLKRQAQDMGVSPTGLDKLGEIFRNAWRGYLAQEDAPAPAQTRKPDAEAILTQLTRMESTFTRQDLARAVSAATDTAEAFTKLMAQVEASPELMVAPLDKERLSTRTMVRTEEEMARAADIMAASYGHPIRGVVERAEAARHLSDEQKAALIHVTGGTGIACVVGYAGTGKSTMLGAAREMWEASGYAVRGLALAGIAAENLEGGSGIASTTLSAFEWQLQNGRAELGKKDVLVIDEAGMIGSRQMHRVLTAARDAGAKVVLVGDPSQLQAIEAGGAFAAVIDRVGAAHITTVRRQGAEWQQAATRALADGHVHTALQAYQKNGSVLAHATKEAAMAALVEQWAIDLHDKAPALILAATRKDVAMLNHQARTAMRSAGLLGPDAVIQARNETIGEPAQDLRLRVAEGERLLFTKNDKRLGVKNGTLGVLESIDQGKLTVRLDGTPARRITFDLKDYRNLAYGYAVTIHKAQGVTVDRAHVLASRAMDRHSTYVALSRHRTAVSLHYSQTDARDLEALSRRIGRDRPKGTSLDHWGHPQRAKTAERAQVARRISDTLNRAARTRDDARPPALQASQSKTVWRPSQHGRER